MSNTVNAPQGRVSNLHERVNAQSSIANQPMSCVCGSTHFYTVRAEEFANNGYGSAQLRALSMNTEPLYICICGRPVSLKDSSVSKISEGARARFFRSLQIAVEDQKKSQPQGLAQGFVSIAEYKEALETIEELQTSVAWLMSAVEVLNTEHEEDEADVEVVEATGETAEPIAGSEISTVATPAQTGNKRGRKPANVTS